MPQTTFFTAAVLFCIATSIEAQAVQAVRGVGQAAEASADSATQAVAATLTEQLGVLRVYYEATAGVTGPPAIYRGRLGGLVELAEEALRLKDDPERFRRAIVAYNEAAARFARPVAPNAAISDVREFAALAGPGVLGVPTPGVHIIVPDVVFTIGPDVVLLRDPVYSVGVSTNLLGSAIGSAVGVLGSDKLRDYFKNNVSAGTAVPTGGENKLTAQIGLGLGGARIRSVTFWPVINIEQADTADTRTPRALVVKRPTAGSWSAPTFTIAVVPFSPADFKRRVEAGGLVPIVTLGARLPYYYASDPFSTLAALFTNDRSDFERAGVARFSVGVVFPLLRITPP
jgi:hypothetical protein